MCNFLSAQGSISNFVCEIFGIEHDYFGTMLSNMARVSASFSTS